MGSSWFIYLCNFVCTHVLLKRLISRVDSNLQDVFEVTGGASRVASCRLHDIPISHLFFQAIWPFTFSDCSQHQFHDMTFSKTTCLYIETTRLTLRALDMGEVIPGGQYSA